MDSPEQAVTNFLSSKPCTFGLPPPIISTNTSSSRDSSTQSCGAHTPSITSSDQPNPFNLLMNMAPPKIESNGGKDLIYDLELDRWVVKKEKRPSTPAVDIKAPRQPQRSRTSASTPSASSEKNPISSLFAERAARFADTEAAVR